MSTTNHLQFHDLQKQLSGSKSSILQFERKGEIQRNIDLIKIKKGWTTIVELAFAATIVVLLTSQLQQLNKTIDGFAAATGQVSGYMNHKTQGCRHVKKATLSFESLQQSFCKIS